MNRAARLRDDALAFWRAGVAAVNPETLVQQSVHVEGRALHIADELIDLDGVRRLIVVGAGKAGAAMAAGVEAAIGEQLMQELDLQGWVNVPADCVRPLRRITLHAARPAGVNEPTEAGVDGTRRILKLVREAHADDLCLCLISGGGSALLPAPAEGVSLADKIGITRRLSAAGANIEQLNTVRIHLSAVKGGKLAAACRAGKLIALVISDVLGDPLPLIASGPTSPGDTTPKDALRVLREVPLPDDDVTRRVTSFLRSAADSVASVRPHSAPREKSPRVANFIIGNLAVAVDAAGMEAVRRGYDYAMHVASKLEGEASEVGKHLARMAVSMARDSAAPDCLIHGGEPVVTLAPAEDRGLGGRNQQLVLAAMHELQSTLAEADLHELFDRLVVLSGGTDGEDGPTDAAGAFIDGEVVRTAVSKRLDVASYLRRNDAYHFFAAAGGLIKTGPTGTNVCDMRVIITRRG